MNFCMQKDWGVHDKCELRKDTTQNQTKDSKTFEQQKPPLGPRKPLNAKF